jgi:hypothetical protein
MAKRKKHPECGGDRPKRTVREHLDDISHEMGLATDYASGGTHLFYSARAVAYMKRRGYDLSEHELEVLTETGDVRTFSPGDDD